MTIARTADGRTAYYCPMDATLGVIGGKYKVHILWHLGQKGVLRFGQIQRSIPQASAKMLINQLHELESDGLISRKVYPVVPPKTEYTLTGYGRTVLPVLDAMNTWGSGYAKKNDAILIVSPYRSDGTAEPAEALDEAFEA